MRYAARVDANQPEIVKALKRIGCKVVNLSRLGGGIPDLLVGYQGRWCLLELKDGSKPPSERELNPLQVEWHNEHSGFPVYVADSVDAAIKAVTD
jgi:hypothetical protein